MPISMNFDKAKVSVLAFTSRDDFAEFMKKMDGLFDRTKKYPTFYILTDDDTNPADLAKIQGFVREMVRKTDDIAMVKRNLDKGRFPEITG